MRFNSGTVYDELEPTTSAVTDAEVTATSLKVRYPGWVVEAVSNDGFQFRGNYGGPERVDPARTVEFRLYKAVNDVLLFGTWASASGGGDWAIELQAAQAGESAD
jgi:hypothetical protein